MAKRKLELPGIQDLSKEQETVLARPTENRHLVVGGPGTGKSVLTLLRCLKHQANNDEYLLLVYNHLLKQFMTQMYPKALAIDTWDRWFRKQFSLITNTRIPTLPPTVSGYSPIDWKQVLNRIGECPPSTDFQALYLLMDEGQDMPLEFYESLNEFGFENIFDVADQNQQIGDQNSSRQQITDCLDINYSEVVQLRRNYRNSYHIANLAHWFCTSDIGTPPPQLPDLDSSKIPTIYVYKEEKFEDIARRILLLVDRDPQHLVGVITPNNAIRERYLSALQDLVKSGSVEFDNGSPMIQTYFAGSEKRISYDEGSILLINAQSCKGLEFDVVVLADVDRHNYKLSNLDFTRKLFYVMVARARSDVMILMCESHASWIDEFLPKDERILRWQSL